MEEEWKICPINENYECSTLGNIRNKKSLKILKSYNCNGYRYLRLGANYKNSVHRIIGYTFLNLTDDLEIDHINRIKDDNRLENLRVVTKHQNLMNNTSKHYTIRKINGHIYYQVQITLTKNNRFHKCYKTENEAIEKVNELIKIYHNHLYALPY